MEMEMNKGDIRIRGMDQASEKNKERKATKKPRREKQTNTSPRDIETGKEQTLQPQPEKNQAKTIYEVIMAKRQPSFD